MFTFGDPVLIKKILPPPLGVPFLILNSRKFTLVVLIVMADVLKKNGSAFPSVVTSKYPSLFHSVEHLAGARFHPSSSLVNSQAISCALNVCIASANANNVKSNFFIM